MVSFVRYGYGLTTAACTSETECQVQSFSSSLYCARASKWKHVRMAPALAPFPPLPWNDNYPKGGHSNSQRTSYHPHVTRSLCTVRRGKLPRHAPLATKHIHIPHILNIPRRRHGRGSSAAVPLHRTRHIKQHTIPTRLTYSGIPTQTHTQRVRSASTQSVKDNPFFI